MKRTVGREQYFTDPNLAARCIEHAGSLIAFEDYSHIIEPSAGDGAFFDLLPADRRIGVDIDPRHPDIRRADFLMWTPPVMAGPILTIGNPPFGQRAALAFDFLDRACRFSDTVAFILPRSFNKYTFQNRVDTNFHLIGSFDCEEFVRLDGERQSVRTVFQVWQRRDVERERIHHPDRHPDFEMRHGHLSRTSPERLAELRAAYSFTIAQVGARFRPRDVETVTKGSHWFIRPNVPGVRERFELLDFSFLDGMNTAHKSLSKRDIVCAYERVAGLVADSGMS